MKDWQQGIEIEYLKKLVKIIKTEFKPHCYGAFGLPNERDLATCFSKDEVVLTKEEDTILLYKSYKARSSFKDFTGERIEVRSGDIFVKHIAGKQKEKILRHMIESTKGNRLFVEIFEEIQETKDLVGILGLEYISTKIASSSDLKGIYWKGFENGESGFPNYQLQKGEDLTIKVCDPKFVTNKDLQKIKEELINYTSWADHYSGYNKRQSWSAFSLRGYDQDPNFIVKPGEMSQKWKQENPLRLTDRSEWTEIIEKFPFTKSIIESDPFKDSKPDRVRFMRLKSGKGELSRHADITDREAGIQVGKVVRLHIPIITNENVIFHSWDHRGKKYTYNLKEGSLNFIDVRKPHTAINTGDQDRIHLVMDFHSGIDLNKYLTT